MTLASATGWTVGIVLGVVVIAVAAAIVITIVLLARRIARQAKTAEGAVEVVRQQTAELARHRADQRLGRADPARGTRAAEGGGGQMTTAFALSSHGYWAIALVIGLVRGARRGRAARDPDRRRSRSIETLGRRPARDAPARSPANTAYIPQLEATAPVLGLIVDEAVVQDGYMNALTDGFGAVRRRALSTTHLLVLLSVILRGRRGRRARRSR